MLRAANITGLVDATLLASLRDLGGLSERLRSGVYDFEVSDTLIEELEHQREATAAATVLPKRPGRPPMYDDDHYEKVARSYNTHGGRSHLKAVEKECNLSNHQARHHVSEARRRGLIPPWAPPGSTKA